eukprot:gene18135-36922_t
MSIGYVTIGAHDVEAATPFFDATLGALGYERSAPFPGWTRRACQRSRRSGAGGPRAPPRRRHRLELAK